MKKEKNNKEVIKMKGSFLDKSDLTPAQVRASEQPRDHRGRFVSNYDYSPDDEIPGAATSLELQVNAIGNPLALGEDPFGIVDAAIDAEMAGESLDEEEDEEESWVVKDRWKRETPEAREVRYARNSHHRIAVAKRRQECQSQSITEIFSLPEISEDQLQMEAVG